MPVTIIKPAEDTVESVLGPVVSAEQVDEYGALVAKLINPAAKVAAAKKDITKKEGVILKLVDQAVEKDKSITLAGETFEVTVGPKGNKTTITDIEAIRDMLGDEVFMKIATVSVTDLNKYLTGDQVAEVTTSDAINKRRVKVEKL